MKRLLTPYRQIVLVTLGTLIGVGFWIAPEIGVLTLAGVLLFCLLYSLYWFLVLKKRGAPLV